MLKTKFLKLLATVAIVTSMAVPAMAAETSITQDNLNKATSKTTANTTINYTQTSSFTVKIPQTITLDANNKNASYSVSVTGNIQGNQKVTVTPGALTLTDAYNKDNVIATIEPGKKEFLHDEIYNKTATGNGKITAGALSAGKWTGTLVFTIGLDPKTT